MTIKKQQFTSTCSSTGVSFVLRPALPFPNFFQVSVPFILLFATASIAAFMKLDSQVQCFFFNFLLDIILTFSFSSEVELSFQFLITEFKFNINQEWNIPAKFRWNIISIQYEKSMKIIRFNQRSVMHFDSEICYNKNLI